MQILEKEKASRQLDYFRIFYKFYSLQSISFWSFSTRISATSAVCIEMHSVHNQLLYIPLPTFQTKVSKKVFARPPISGRTDVSEKSHIDFDIYINRSQDFSVIDYQRTLHGVMHSRTYLIRIISLFKWNYCSFLCYNTTISRLWHNYNLQYIALTLRFRVACNHIIKSVSKKYNIAYFVAVNTVLNSSK